MSFPRILAAQTVILFTPVAIRRCAQAKALLYAAISGPADGPVFLGDGSGDEIADAIAVMRKG
ncbi:MULTISPECIES: hypothetical protein [unclassified Bradyrhizobium]|uniref:hypothetical protein n=1 Tax=unclassified Bradyrhizobium TaxID=2631580 RepID=UPI001CD5A3D3|nr:MULTISPECIES: hypothetical protein [unclassified Bradyrhizobium]MCA1376647.1 hypothetical protein [Bradyrhizobium sp. IC4060]MCA1542507.1 hypothetical protein [Bradyrhizobium sp. NBAIM32]